MYNVRDTVVTQMTTWETNLSAQMSAWQTALDLKLDELKDALLNSYDSTGSEEVNQKTEDFFNSQEQNSEGTTDVAVENLDNFEMPSDSLSVGGEKFISAISLVSSMMESAYTALGDFSIVTTFLFAVVITAMLTGLFKFYTG